MENLAVTSAVTLSDSYAENQPRPLYSKAFFNKLVILVFAFGILQSCFETKQGEAQKIAPTPTSGVSLMAIGGDIPQDPVPEWNCVFNGAAVVNGDSITAFQNSSVGYGQSCVSETRICREAVLSGSFAYATCAVAAPNSCLFDGQTVEHGSSVTAFSTSAVSFGSSCTDVAQVRTCNDGALSGNAQYAVCRVNEPRSCLFDGRTIVHGETVQAFSTSTTEFGGQCTSETRQCNDGTLSGNYAFSSCVIDQPASCLFDGRTISHGASVVAYATSSAAFGESCLTETRLCSNGQLSGTYTVSACVVNEPANCQFNGLTVAHGESVIAYNVATASSSVACQSEVRSCQNGNLSGAFFEIACVTPPPVEPPTDPNPPTDPPSVPPTDPVPPTNPPTDPIPPTVPPVDPIPEKSCLMNGKEIPSGSSITLFVSSQVTAPALCVSEVRVCQNGALSGSAVSETCVQINPPPVEPPTDPVPPTVPPTDPPTVPPTDPNPPTTPPTDPPGQCTLDGLIWELPNECNSCGSSIGFQKSRISRDGGKTWLVIKSNKLPEDLDAIWNYMGKKHGKNRCGRPNVNYSVSPRNLSLLVMDPKTIPGCDVCQFKEYKVEYTTGNTCSYKKNRQTKTVVKFVCEEPKKQCEQKCCDHKQCDRHKHCDKKSCDHKEKDKKKCEKKSCDYKKSCDHKQCDKKKSCTLGHDWNGKGHGHEHHDDDWNSKGWKW